ncbi:MAG TPA: histidine kinase dimerization/phospho-acceptor domain-containing protein [Polyangia bacterium]|nr:histidine kinase dimerization/phospho-acceptor domain-containing protein [Polyangia bacterium]
MLEPLAREIWELRHQDAPPSGQRLRAAEALGPAYLERGAAPSAAVRQVLRVGREMVEQAEQGGLTDAAGARRLGALVDEAAAQVAQSVEAARRARRQSWLSFLVHEVKNPLNTVLNALWLLREKGADPVQAARFIDLAERAVRRLEGRAKDVRQLDEQLTTPPPGWEASRSAISS